MKNLILTLITSKITSLGYPRWRLLKWFHIVSSPLVDGKNVNGGQKLVYHVATSTDGKNDTFERKIMINGHDRMPEETRLL